jgi:hypothetical protein
MQGDGGELRGECGRGAGAFLLALGHGCLHIARGDARQRARERRECSTLATGIRGGLSPVVSPQAPGTNLTSGHTAPIRYRSRPPAAMCRENSTGWAPSSFRLHGRETA